MSNSISSLYKIKRIEELFCTVGYNFFTDDLFTAAERKIATLIPPLDIPLLLSISARVNEAIFFYVWGKAKEIKVALLDIRKGT